MRLRAFLTDPARAAKLERALLLANVILFAGWIAYIVASDKPIDFYVYYLAAFGFTRGIDIYSMQGYRQAGSDWAALAREAGVQHHTFPYRYPPLTAEIAWPLTLLGPRPAAVAWLIASAAAFILSAYLLARLTDERWGKPVALALLLLFVPALTTLRAGQINALLLLSMCAGLYFLVQRRAVATGIAVAVAGMLKLVPFALLGYLFWRRQWRAALVGVGATVALLLAAVPMMGWSGLVSYGRNFFSLGLANSLVPSAPNQSFNGFFARLFVAGPDRAYVLDAPGLAQGLYLGASIALVLATVALCWPRGDIRWLGELEFALITTAVNLLTPYVWYYQLALLLIPFFVLIKQALTLERQGWMLWPLVLGYAAIGLHGLVWQRLAFSPILSSMPFFATIMLWGLLAFVIVKAKWGSGFDRIATAPYHHPLEN